MSDKFLKERMLWNSFCQEQQLLEKAVPLFATEWGCVVTGPYGESGRLYLQRSPEMEKLVVVEVTKVCADYESGTEHYDGLIYPMCWQKHNEVIPLYFGKAEKYGKNHRNLSANLRGIPRGGNRSNFCRWGSGYAYHIGDLSAVVCPDHQAKHQHPKYCRWAERLFIDSTTRRLSQPVYFWIKAWSSKQDQLSTDFDPTRLTFLEYLLIGIGSSLYPELILNTDGVNRN